MDMKEKFIRDFPVPKGDKKEPYIIVFDAYCGQGKSYTSKIISQYDHSIILINDQVRYWLNNYTEDVSDILHELQYHRLELLLQNHNSCIWDSCAGHNWDKKRARLEQIGYPYYVIRLQCREETVRERMKNRKVDNNINFSIGTFDDYLWCVEHVPPIADELISYTIDTEQDVDSQAKQFLKKYHLMPKK